MQVLIVDDEINIRNGLKTIIDWSKLGCEIIGEADNGEKAYHLIKEIKPDLCILDIKMPRMNGIEVIEKLYKEGYRDIAFILLSGYGEFEYAKRAMICGVNHYVLKPIEEEVLIEKVKEVIETKKSQKRKDTLAFNEALRSLLKHGAEKETTRNLYLMDLPWLWYQVVILHIVECNQAENLVIEALERVGKKYITKGFYLSQIGEYYILLVKNHRFKHTFAGLESMIMELTKALTNEDKIPDIFISVGESVDTLEQVSMSYREAKSLMDYQFVYTRNNLMTYHLLKEEMSTQVSIDLEETVATLKQAIELGQTTVINDILEHFLENILKTKWHAEQIIIYYVQFYLRLMLPILEKNEIVSKEVSLNDETLKSFYKQKDVRRLHGHIKYHIMQVSEAISRENPESKVELMIHYIKEHYKEELLLEGISKMLGYNSSYLGKQFKKKMGVSFNAYLDQIRIEAGKVLLIETQLKIYEVAKACGFSDPDYFSTKFKKIEGFTPNQYRKHHKVK